MTTSFNDISLRYFQKYFDLLDHDKIGRVQTDELPNLVRICGAAPLEADINMLKEIADPDRRGSFNFEGFCKAQEQALRGSISAKDCRTAFSGFDPDRRGFIVPHRLRYFLTTMGDALTTEEANQFFEEMRSELDMEGNIVMADAVYKMTPEMYR